MRGRTNVVQRTGPTVIGNLVTQKQVTGSAISMGDFVEFTGQSSNYETLDGPFNFTLSSFTKVPGVNVGEEYNCVVYWSPSEQFKFVIFDNEGNIINSTTLIDIESSTNPNYSEVTDLRHQFFATYSNGKIYVGVPNYCKNGSEYNLQNNNAIFVFLLNLSVYSVSWDTSIKLDIIWNDYGSQNQFSSYALYIPFVIDGYIFCVISQNSSSYSSRLYKLNIDATAIVDTFTMANISSHVYPYVVDSYVLLMYTASDNSNIFVYNRLSGLFHQSANYINNRVNYGYMQEINGFIFLVYLKFSHVSQSIAYYYKTICVMYVNSSNDVVIVDYIDLTSIGYKLGVEIYYPSLYVERDGYDYKIFVVNTNSRSDDSSYSQMVYEYLTFNSNESDLKFVDKKSFVRNFQKTGDFENIIVDKDDDVYSVFLTDNVGYKTSYNNYLCKTNFGLNANVITNVQSYDLVKKYSNLINGVAKTGGSAGQLISVYIP